MSGLRAALAAALLCLPAASVSARQDPPLGPHDGHNLAPVDTGRVGTGDTAPDFTLRARDGSIVSLGDYRGRRNVILVFYRGYW